MIDPNELLALPVGAGRGQRRWLASELVHALCARVGLAQLGPHATLLRRLLLEAWRRGRSPHLDDLLLSAVQGSGSPDDDLEMNWRLELMLRFVVRAPEFGVEGNEAPLSFTERAAGARVAVTVA